MRRWLPLVFAWIAYLAFARSMLYMIAFVADVVVTKTIDRDPSGSGPVPVSLALVIDTALLAGFVVPHSMMARTGFKAWLGRFVDPRSERSLYVLVSSLLLMLLLWQWRPMPMIVWQVDSNLVSRMLLGISAAGWLLALLASYDLGHMTTFGVKSALDRVRGRPSQPRALVTRGLHGVVRHPMYLGFLIGIWATPRMSAGHLYLAVLLSLYVVMGRLLEERDLARRYGEKWGRYEERVPAFLPRFASRRARQ